MPFEEMKIQGAWVHTPDRHIDERGYFQETFKLSEISEAIGRDFRVAQVNQSISNKGVIRGIHYTNSLVGQAKYISCSKGEIWDVVVDLRPESRTYGEWDAALLSEENGKSVLISENLGHAFLSLEVGSVCAYLCTSEYNPVADIAIHPFSRSIGIDFKSFGASRNISDFQLSDRDAQATVFQPKYIGATAEAGPSMII
jgi:dTDP-4-dehydrorhamnose 3,5-epimerase